MTSRSDQLVAPDQLLKMVPVWFLFGSREAPEVPDHDPGAGDEAGPGAALPRRISGATYRRFLCSVNRRGGVGGEKPMATKETGRTEAPPPPPPPSRCFIDAHNPGVDPENKLLRLQRVSAEFSPPQGCM